MKFIIKALELIFTILTLLFLVWVIACLYATFHDAKAAKPAIVTVIGIPSALRPNEGIYMRWHRCFVWCD